MILYYREGGRQIEERKSNNNSNNRPKTRDGRQGTAVKHTSRLHRTCSTATRIRIDIRRGRSPPARR